MKAVVQRVAHAEVRVDGKVVGHIGRGLLILLGVATGDTEQDLEYLADKCVHLRIFEDRNGKMNLSLIDVGGELLVISQFTLLGDTRRGRRPSFIAAAPSEQGRELYKQFVRKLRSYGLKVETGIFGAMMDVDLINYGPVTLILDSKDKKLP